MPKKTLYTIAAVVVAAAVGYWLWKRSKTAVTSYTPAILPAEKIPTSKLGAVTNWIGDVLKTPSTQSTISSWFN